jgi:hypothetical protein
MTIKLNDNDNLKQILRGILKLIASQDTQILQLIASITVLKWSVAQLKGESGEFVISAFRALEQEALKELSAPRQLQEVRDLIDLLEKHGQTFEA